MQENRLYIDLNHPADFHLFKNLVRRLEKEGWKIRVSARDKDCLHELLEDASIPYIDRGRGSRSRAGKYLGAPLILLKLLYELIRFRPRLSLSLSSPYIILASRLLRIPSICYDDTDINPRLLPHIRRASCVLSPENYRIRFHRQHLRLPLMKEMAYLEPAGLEQREGVFVRLALGDSIHHSPHSRKFPGQAVKELASIAERYRMIISSEFQMEEFDDIRHEKARTLSVHRDLSSCRVFWGNSATMAAEAAVMGIPAVFLSDEKFCYIAELEQRGLLLHFPLSRAADSFGKLEELLEKASPEDYMEKSSRLSREKLDTGKFLFDFVTGYPESMDALATRNDIKQSR